MDILFGFASTFLFIWNNPVFNVPELLANPIDAKETERLG